MIAQRVRASGEVRWPMDLQVRRPGVWHIGFRISGRGLPYTIEDKSIKFCGSCGYTLNLASSNSISIGSGYQKASKKGVITFLSIDVSRFTQVDEVKCIPYSWGPRRMKTQLLCRNCGVLIGYGHGGSSTICCFGPQDLPYSASLPATHNKYTINVKAVQPSENTGLQN